MPRPPTPQTYAELQHAYDHLNRALFSGTLPHCLITLQRSKHTFGYFSADRFVSLDGNKAHEIALNPTFFAAFPLTEMLATLTHEMVHLWQHVYGKPSRRAYHNREWAAKMIEIGLHPSDTGKPGGKITGERMSDYVVPGGAFDVAARALLHSAFRLSWYDRFLPGLGLVAGHGSHSHDGSAAQEHAELGFERPAARADTRSRYRCRTCGYSVWGKRGLQLTCRACGLDLE